jgi:hypothetical protein
VDGEGGAGGTAALMGTREAQGARNAAG